MRDAVVGSSETRMDIGQDLAWSAGHDEIRVRQRGLTGFLARVLEKRFCDRIGQVSRPILLLSVILLDFVIVTASGFGALSATGQMPPVDLAHMIAIGLVSGFVVTALSTNWSYSIGALRQPAAQMGKILTAVAIVTISLSGVLHLAGVIVVKPVAVVAWAGLTGVALALTRLVEARTIEHLARAHRLRRRAVIVGGGKTRPSCSNCSRTSRAISTSSAFSTIASGCARAMARIPTWRASPLLTNSPRSAAKAGSNC